MVSFRSFLAVAPLLATVLAKVGFTSVPATAVAGNRYNISWAGGDDSPVTLTLRRGDPQNLATVTTIADKASGSSYVWTVPSNLPSGDDYALQITQGQSDINWSGLFSISGSSSNSTSSSSSTAAVASTTHASNSSMAITSAASASGTGTAMSRNSTFSSATLTSSSSDSFSFGETTSSTQSSASRTATTSQSTNAPSNDASVRTGASSAALILGIVAAVMLH